MERKPIPIPKKDDGSSVRTKVAQYLVKQRIQELKTKSAAIKIDGSALPQPASGAHDLPPSQLPPLSPGKDGDVRWNDLLKVFREKWSKAQKEYKASDEAGRHWDEKGFPTLPAKGYRVAIIGAGAAGLRTAMLLQKMHIPYKIFEASDRPGGRLFTYHFPSKDPDNPQGKHDYYDVGGMRFPNNTANEATIELFNELKLPSKGKVIKYVLSNKDNIRYYNNIGKTAEDIRTNADHFHDREFVPEEYLLKEYTDSFGRKSVGVDACTAAAYDEFRKDLIDDFDEGWKKLMAVDWASTRSYLARELDPPYPLPVVHWMETRNGGTGRYERAFTEAILESLEFDDPSKTIDWFALEGGSEVLIEAMLEELKTKPFYNHRVTAIEKVTHPTLPEPLFPSVRISVAGKEDEGFSHVVSTSTFANLRNIDTDKVPMTYKQRQAIRTLNYNAAIKVGIKFKTRWWEKDGRKQFGGSTYTDRQSRVTVYPSAGLGEDGPGVLMVAYNWDQDAARFGALIEKSDWSKQLEPDRVRPPSEEVLLEQIYDNLAVVHNVGVDYLRGETLDYHAFDWYHCPHTMGAYAKFAPGQFSTFLADIVQPAGHGRFHFAGEVASHNHAWVGGALDSAKRAVAEIIRLDFPFLIPNYREACGMSLLFDDDEKSAEEEFLVGLFSKELEDAGF